MDRETVWDVVVAERRALHEHLRELTPEEWEHPSVCEGWRVRDVAAHVISAPQLDWPTTLRTARDAWRGYNRMIFRDARRRGSAPVAEILAQYDAWAGVRRGPATVTHLEPLIDVLVHTQDVLRPLGRHHAMPPDAAAVAADRARWLSPLSGSAGVVRRTRMRATDADWERGRGPLLEGPMSELLLVCMNRPAAPGTLTGAAADAGVGQPRETGTSTP